jgi:hypothetical protein
MLVNIKNARTKLRLRSTLVGAATTALQHCLGETVKPIVMKAIAEEVADEILDLCTPITATMIGPNGMGKRIGEALAAMGVVEAQLVMLQADLAGTHEKEDDDET